MGDDIREEIQQLIREVREPRDAEIAELRQSEKMLRKMRIEIRYASE